MQPPIDKQLSILPPQLHSRPLPVQAALKQLKEKAAGKGGFAKATNVTGKKK